MNLHNASFSYASFSYASLSNASSTSTSIDTDKLTAANFLSIIQILIDKQDSPYHIILQNEFIANLKNLFNSSEIQNLLNDNRPETDYFTFITILRHLKRLPEIQTHILKNYSSIIKQIFNIAVKKLTDPIHQSDPKRECYLDFEALHNNIDLQRLIIDIPNKMQLFMSPDYSIEMFNPASKDKTFIKLLIFLKDNPILQDIFDLDSTNISEIKKILECTDDEQKVKLSELLMNMKKFLEFRKSGDPEKVDIYKHVFQIFTESKQRELLLIMTKTKY